MKNAEGGESFSSSMLMPEAEEVTRFARRTGESNGEDLAAKKLRYCCGLLAERRTREAREGGTAEKLGKLLYHRHRTLDTAAWNVGRRWRPLSSRLHGHCSACREERGRKEIGEEKDRQRDDARG
nr:hypothetical protein Itr_chr09CG13670 [Ipomoea trifida]